MNVTLVLYSNTNKPPPLPHKKGSLLNVIFKIANVSLYLFLQSCTSTILFPEMLNKFNKTFTVTEMQCLGWGRRGGGGKRYIVVF